MDTREYHLKVVEILITVIGLAAAGWGAWQAYLTYRQHAELQTMRALNDAQLKVCLQIPDGPNFRSEVRCILQNEPFELALSCRRMMGEAFRKEAGKAVPLIDPKYVMSWKGECPKK